MGDNSGAAAADNENGYPAAKDEEGRDGRQPAPATDASQTSEELKRGPDEDSVNPLAPPINIGAAS